MNTLLENDIDKNPYPYLNDCNPEIRLHILQLYHTKIYNDKNTNISLLMPEYETMEVDIAYKHMEKFYKKCINEINSLEKKREKSLKILQKLQQNKLNMNNKKQDYINNNDSDQFLLDNTDSDSSFD